MFCKPSFEVIPEMFYAVKVRRLCRTYHSPKFLLIWPLHDLLASMLKVIVLLKDYIQRIKTMKPREFWSSSFKIWGNVSHHPTINTSSIESFIQSHSFTEPPLNMIVPYINLSLSPFLTFSKPICNHLTPGDWFGSCQTIPPPSSHP